MYVEEGEQLHFHGVAAPTEAELHALVHRIGERIGRCLERQGLLVRDPEHSALSLDSGKDALEGLLGHSITYRIALGPHRGQKAFTLKTLPAQPPLPSSPPVAHHAGFSLHAGVATPRDPRRRRERLCRYIARPAVAIERLSLTAQGHVRYQLKTPYRDGVTHVVLEPLDLMARLAALIPKPWVNLTRHQGVLAPHSHWRVQLTRAQRGKDSQAPGAKAILTPSERRAAMSWAQRLKRVFGIENSHAPRSDRVPHTNDAGPGGRPRTAARSVVALSEWHPARRLSLHDCRQVHPWVRGRESPNNHPKHCNTRELTFDAASRR